MKLGAMLVRDGRLTQDQIDAAIAQQARRGGRLGTVLVEMRLIDADTLTVYLGLELGIPIATRAALDRAKRAAVRLLTPELAERFRCVPLVVQDRQLIAAVGDPHDLLALDEIGAATGCRVIPRVAPEVRLYYYIERYYGVPRPDRYRALGDLVLQGAGRGGSVLEAPPPPLPGLPPVSHRPVAMPPPPPLRLVEDAGEELAMELEADAAEPAEERPPPILPGRAPSPDGPPAPPPAPPPPVVSAVSAAPTAPPPAAMAPPPAAMAPPPAAVAASVVDAHGPSSPTEAPIEPLAAADALARMERASSRSEIADAIVGYARGHFDVAVLCVVRDDIAFGWKGFGPDLDLDRIETLMVPLGAASVLRSAAETLDLVVGALPPSAIHAHLFKVLRTRAPRQAVVAPVVIRERVVNLLYVHRNGEAELADASLVALREITQAAASAYARLIALQKRSG